MTWSDEQISWNADGRTLPIGLTRFGTGPALLLLPALSSISTRTEMRPLQERLGARFSTLAIDWPGFGTLPRPKLDWRPDHYRAFLRFVLETLIQPSVTVAAGHAAGYALAQAADHPSSTGRLCLLSPTWRGPLPTMMSRRSDLFRLAPAAIDLPVIGPALYRLNINGPVIGMMARGHVYGDPAWLTPERMAEKRAVTDAPGARHASIRFVTGALDPFADRDAFLDAARRIETGLLMIHAEEAPPKSKAEMRALSALPNVTTLTLPHGKLSFYEEFAAQTAQALLDDGGI